MYQHIILICILSGIMLLLFLKCYFVCVAFHNAPPPGPPVYNEGVPVPPPPATSAQLRMMPFLPSGPPPPYPPPPIINYVPSPAYALPLQPPVSITCKIICNMSTNVY